MINATNATGWSELYNGQTVLAAFTLFDTALQGWTIGILFVLFEIMLLIKTRNPAAAFMTSLMFAVLYFGSVLLKPQVGAIMILVIVIELAAILYVVLFK